MQVKETQHWIAGAGAENDADKGTAFGALLGALHEELFDRIIPAERAVMLGQVSKGAKAVLATMRPEGVVTAKKGHRRIIGLTGRLHDILSWCRIRALHLHDVNLERPDVEGLVAVLGQCGSLTVLSLNHNTFGDEGAERLSEVLGKCGLLAHLDLSWNEIGNKGLQRLAEALGQCKSLAHLDLGFNECADEGAERLAEVLGKCKSLTHLDLGGNDIGNGGSGKLADVLGNCGSLAHLDLSCNEIGGDGLQRLADMLRNCKSLTHLDLGANLWTQPPRLYGGVGRVVRQAKKAHKNSQDSLRSLSDVLQKSRQALGSLGRALGSLRSAEEISLMLARDFDQFAEIGTEIAEACGAPKADTVFLKQTIRVLSATIAERDKTITQRDAEVGRLERELEALKAAHAPRKGQITKELEAHLASLDEQLAEELKNEEALAKTLAEERRKVAELEKMLKRTTAADFDKNEQALAEDNKVFASKDAEIAYLKQSIKKLSATIADRDKTIRKRDADLLQEHAVASLSVQLAAPKARRICGVGMTLQAVEGREELCVTRLLPGLPAALCGRIMLGDAILSVDGFPVHGCDLDTVVKMIKGEEHTPVVLRFSSPGMLLYRVTLARGAK